MNRPELLLIDDTFPQYRGAGFAGRKHAEFIGFLELIPEAVTVCPPHSFSGARDSKGFLRDRDLLLQSYPALSPEKITYCQNLSELRGDLAYCVFPHYAHRLLPWLEARRLPFTFTIYPGGGFLMWGAGQGASDNRLRALFSSRCFAGVFVHHAIIRRYLEAMHGLTEQIFFLKGGFSQMDPSLIRPKTFYGFERQAMNICFVANRYDPMGLGKGYDVFINAAKRLSSLRPDCRFHVVGDWSRDIIDVSDIGDKVQFHGYLATDALAHLYSEMDAIVSPTRIDVPREGKFDGFPLVTDAGICGVAMFVSDPLGQNEDFVQGEELEIIRSDPDDVVERLLPYCSDPARLRDMSIRGQRRISELRNKEEKLAAKAAILKTLMVAKR